MHTLDTFLRKIAFISAKKITKFFTVGTVATLSVILGVFLSSTSTTAWAAPSDHFITTWKTDNA